VRRVAFVDAAARLIQTKGFERMSVQDLLDAPGASRGAFYHYFDSKVELLAAVVERMVEDGMAAVRPVLADPGLSPGEKLTLGNPRRPRSAQPPKPARRPSPIVSRNDRRHLGQRGDRFRRAAFPRRDARKEMHSHGLGGRWYRQFETLRHYGRDRLAAVGRPYPRSVAPVRGQAVAGRALQPSG
jgi:AcrR family transcriptional regulator